MPDTHISTGRPASLREKRLPSTFSGLLWAKQVRVLNPMRWHSKRKHLVLSETWDPTPLSIFPVAPHEEAQLWRTWIQVAFFYFALLSSSVRDQIFKGFKSGMKFGRWHKNILLSAWLRRQTDLQSRVCFLCSGTCLRKETAVPVVHLSLRKCSATVSHMQEWARFTKCILASSPV